MGCYNIEVAADCVDVDVRVRVGQEVRSSLPTEDCGDYNKVKAAVLRAY